jgi:hypothetical protein
MDFGDICVLRGGLYRETVVPVRDGVTFRAHPGEVPVVSGCDPVDAWRKEAGGIFRTSAPLRVREVFLCGKRMPIARWPDEDGDPFTTAEWAATRARNTSTRGAGTAVILFAGVAWKEGQWVGGRYWGLHGDNAYQGNQGDITASGADSLTLANLNGNLQFGLKEFEGPGWGYIVNHPAARDAPGEWCWGAGALHFRPPDRTAPLAGAVEARVRLYGFDLSGRRDVKIEGVRFFASSVLMDSSRGCSLERCAFLHHAPWGDYRAPEYGEFDRGNHEYGQPAWRAGSTLTGDPTNWPQSAR